MKMTASRRLLGVVNLTTWMPSDVVLVSTGVMLSGIGSPKGTLRSSLRIAAEAGGDVGATLGQADVTTGRGEGAADDELPVQPATPARTTPDRARAASFTPPRYVTGNDTICW